ncbi:MAG: hypothetical protein LBJ84_04575, partial [Oscillospiraceae bacterium]|nr:hypothetical protein [Oscillospiraceae bacterium]
MKRNGLFAGLSSVAARGIPVLILAGLVIGLLPPGGGGTRALAAPEPPVKDGYTLAPEVYSASGVLP